MRTVLTAIANNEMTEKNIIKSHYNGEFFNQELINELNEHYHIFYIYRNVDDTLKSCWKHYKDLKEIHDWDAGTVTDTPEEFKSAEPFGACLRYQFRQYKNMRERCEHHKESWLCYDNVIFVKYEDLNTNFRGVVEDIRKQTGMALFQGDIFRPMKNRTVQNGVFVA
jgi:hypothetical protein